jgi:hypothetical protein
MGGLMESVPVILRIPSKIDFTQGDCWQWTAYCTKEGYGRISVNNESTLAHRVIYEELVGQIPEGLELDHLCRNRSCVNPAHLEPVTHLINVRRGEARPPIRAHTDVCVRGHLKTPENTRIVPGTDKRECRKCRVIYQQEYRKRKKASPSPPGDSTAGSSRPLNPYEYETWA